MNQVIIDDLAKWEFQLINAANSLFREGERDDLFVFNKPKTDESCYDPRLNLAYSMYLIEKLYIKTPKPKYENWCIKNDLEKLGLYCPKTDLAIGLYANGCNLKRVDDKSRYYWKVDIKPLWSEIRKSSIRDECFQQMKESIENSINQKEVSQFSVEEFVWIENNQILTSQLDFSNVNRLQKSLAA